MEVVPGEDDAQVWTALTRRLETYLSAQGLSRISIERRPGPPERGPDSGKLRKVLIEPGALSGS